MSPAFEIQPEPLDCQGIPHLSVLCIGVLTMILLGKRVSFENHRCNTAIWFSNEAIEVRTSSRSPVLSPATDV